ncbi:MAG: Crp/Fnr family transcriptional regulator [Pseudomonadales bacterium]
MSNPGILMVVRQNPMFRDLPAALHERVAGLCQMRKLAKGELLFRQGEPGTALFGIISGQLRISANSADGQEFHLNVVGAGEMLGEIALLDGGERTASAFATRDCMVFSLPRDSFLTLVQEESQLSVHLLALLCARIRWTSDIVEDVAFRSVPMRLARRVAILARLHGEQTPEGQVLRLSQAELAQFLNVSRQIVNGNLQAWQKLGVIAVSRGKITVKDFDGLESAAEASQTD